MSVRTGLEVWQAEGFARLRGRRVGAIGNPTSVDRRFRHLSELLAEAKGVKLCALFGPEHGIRGEAQYMEPVGEQTDPRTGVAVHSLYGHTFESLTPRPEWLEGLDAVVFDIQDVGSRYYTYVCTMALAMRACAKAKVPFFVLDRPNPIGGVAVEGNLPAPRFRSFVGLYELPNRHGMTAGELARMIDAEEGFGCELEVVPCEGWSREAHWERTGLSFVPPSPNMPTPDTARVYPGMCLLEGTNLSEGRGTCRPFEQFGAPWLDASELVETLTREALPGVGFREAHFTPTFDKYRGQSCAGAMLHVTDPEVFLPLRTGIAVVRAARALGGEAFAWRTDAYEFVEDIPAFDLLCGTDRIRGGIEEGAALEKIVAPLEVDQERFRQRRRPWLLYT